MEQLEGGIKRKSRLAVFEHVRERQRSQKKTKFRPNRLEADDSSPSESEMVIEDERDEREELPTQNKKIRLAEEPLNLRCEWNFCDDRFDSWAKLDAHLSEHVTVQPDNLTCRWSYCKETSASTPYLMQHVSYHGYLSKLKNIGQNMLDRNKWPECKLLENYKIPVCSEGYTCMWEYCFLNFLTIYDFYSHMVMHVHNNPRVANEKLNEIIQCGWQVCGKKFSSKYKLAEHVRSHTKEKVIACPTCCTTFFNRTKLSDHRKRQLATDLQSYQCSQCFKLLASERLLRDHMRSHINQYKCTMCDMTCTKPSQLALHMRYKHIKDKCFKCHTCEKSFVAKHNLDVHLRTHSDQPHFKCEQCDFECQAKVTLDKHCVKVHEKSKTIYQCHCCKKEFKRGSYLTRHLIKLHNYRWPSGHTRFRYRKDQDGVHRLQTVRYESLEVTEEMLRSEGERPNVVLEDVNYHLRYDSDGRSNYMFSISPEGEPETGNNGSNNILITIDDVDEHGNVIRSEVFESGDIVDAVFTDGVVADKGNGGEDEEGAVKVKRKKSKKKKKRKKGQAKQGRSVPMIKVGKEEEDVLGKK
ncbi:hypothetical protein NQ315_016421 [Exocentrus adspersus]|uniref:C2H2-type domain-containing protein n=1 Tax=Exocentrus adspersus TaxID=1586481 RepID=A0AAV8VQY8_9CUCU|nr:hypothetical protein NQ315_016421 [Exocentrus adspersus]